MSLLSFCLQSLQWLPISSLILIVSVMSFSFCSLLALLEVWIFSYYKTLDLIWTWFYWISLTLFWHGKGGKDTASLLPRGDRSPIPRFVWVDTGERYQLLLGVEGISGPHMVSTVLCGGLDTTEESWMPWLSSRPLLTPPQKECGKVPHNFQMGIEVLRPTDSPPALWEGYLLKVITVPGLYLALLIPLR